MWLLSANFFPKCWLQNTGKDPGWSIRNIPPHNNFRGSDWFYQRMLSICKHIVHRLLNTMLSPSEVAKSKIVLSLDAEKAFDRVLWRYLFEVMERFGFGANFISWVQTLCSVPGAQAQTNNQYSQFFLLSHRTCQGCPLCSLLFTLAIEPLAIKLKTSTYLWGIQRSLCRWFIYTVCVKKITQVLDDFGTFSGYKINFQKTMVPSKLAQTACTWADTLPRLIK